MLNRQATNFKNSKNYSIKTHMRVHVFRKIKVWDLAAALDPRAPAGTLCIKTLVVSTHLPDWAFYPPYQMLS